MPRGPKGQKRPADVVGNAVHVMRVLTGEAEEEYVAKPEKNEAAAELGRKGGAARAKADDAGKEGGDRPEGGGEPVEEGLGGLVLVDDLEDARRRIEP